MIAASRECGAAVAPGSDEMAQVKAYMSKVKPAGALNQFWYATFDTDHVVMAQLEASRILAVVEPPHEEALRMSQHRGATLPRGYCQSGASLDALAESLTAFCQMEGF